MFFLCFGEISPFFYRIKYRLIHQMFDEVNVDHLHELAELLYIKVEMCRDHVAYVGVNSHQYRLAYLHRGIDLSPHGMNLQRSLCSQHIHFIHNTFVFRCLQCGVPF